MATKTWTSDADFNTGTFSQVETDTDKLVLSQQGVWSFGGDVNVDRWYVCGAGLQDATWTTGGADGSAVKAITEEFDGTTWTSAGDISLARRSLAGAGTVSAGLCMGGVNLGGGTFYSNTEEYNGSVWTSGGDLNATRGWCSAAGTLTAALINAGTITGSTQQSSTEHYDGTSWTTGGDIILQRNGVAGCGTETAALCICGNVFPGIANDQTEHYDGTSWTSGGDSNTARLNLGAGGVETAALNFGGTTGGAGYSWVAEEYNGTAWSSTTNLNTTKSGLGGSGTQSAGLSWAGYNGSFQSETQLFGYFYYTLGTWSVDFDSGSATTGWGILSWTERSSVIEFNRSVVASDTTTATSLEDVTGLSCTITLVNTSHIVAWMSLSTSVDTVGGKKGYFAISIDSVDSPVLERFHSSVVDYGSIGTTYRTVTKLAPGTYTIKGRWYTESGVTLTGTMINLVAMALEDESGNEIASAYDTVASDTTSSGSIEDVDGLSQSITLHRLSHLFGVVAVSTSTNSGNKSITTGINEAGHEIAISRMHSSANDKGVVCQVSRTNTLLDGSPTVKGVWSTTAATATGAPFIMTVIGLETEEVNPKTVVSSHVDNIVGTSTASNIIIDITDLSTTIILSQPAKIFACMSIQSSIDSSAKNGFFAININGTDYDIIQRTHGSANDQGAVCVFACTASTLAAGTYTVKGRWYVESGTLTGSNMSLVAIAGEAIVGIVKARIKSAASQGGLASADFYPRTLTGSGAWSFGGNLNQARSHFSGCGSQTSGLAVSGYSGSYTLCEEYTGTSWCSAGLLNTGRYYNSTGGTQTDAFTCGNQANTTSTEEYDGTSWSAGGNLNTGNQAAAGCGTSTAGLSMGGYVSATNSKITEEYNSGVWSASDDLNAARRCPGAGGTQIAALAIGGGYIGVLASTEEYDGTSWSTTADLTYERGFTQAAGKGTITAGFVFGGRDDSGFPNEIATAESFDGTTWSTSNSLNTARYVAGSAGNITNALCFGGYSDAVGIINPGTTEESSPGWASDYYTIQPQDVECPDGRWCRLELSLIRGSTPEITDINQNYGEGC